MNVFEISTRPPNSYLFNSSTSTNHPSTASTSTQTYSNNTNPHHSFNSYPHYDSYQQSNNHHHHHHPTYQHHHHQCPHYQTSSFGVANNSPSKNSYTAITPTHHLSRRAAAAAAVNPSMQSPSSYVTSTSRHESPSINLKQRSSSTNSQFPRNTNTTSTNGQVVNTAVAAAVRYNGHNPNQYSNGGGGGSVNPNLKTGVTNVLVSSTNGNLSTPSSPYLSSSSMIDLIWNLNIKNILKYSEKKYSDFSFDLGWSLDTFRSVWVGDFGWHIILYSFKHL